MDPLEIGHVIGVCGDEVEVQITGNVWNIAKTVGIRRGQ